MSNFQFTLHSGRRIGITAMGEPAASRVLVLCHPAPGSSHFDPDPIASMHRDEHIIAIDRPGYGSSDPLPAGQWPSVAGAADDIAEYLRSSENSAHAIEAHQLDSVGVAGWSAGGRVALALAARHPDIVDRVAVIGTPAPHEEVPWIAPEFVELSAHLATLSAQDAIEQLSETFSTRMSAQMPSEDPEKPVPLVGLGATDVDAGVLEMPGARDRLEVMVRDAFRQGPIGVVTDILAYAAQPWGFDLSDVASKVLLLYGEADESVPPRHGEWYAGHLADAQVETVPNAGHLLIVPMWARVLSHLAAGSTWGSMP